VIILTAHRDRGYVDRAMQVGALGFLVKIAAAAELPTALEAVTRGERFISSLVRRQDGDG
jgi:DNA-binding NarL/FixJ family response regulator